MRIELEPRSHTPRLVDGPMPSFGAGNVVVETVATGICGTDKGLVKGGRAEPPQGARALVLGHEAAGRVVSAPPRSGLRPGQIVVPLVRRRCGRCPACRAGRRDACETGDFIEAGIHRMHGYMAQRWADEAAYLLPAPQALGWRAVLAEPLSVVVKALERARTATADLPWRSRLQGQSALVIGMGSLGSLAVLLLRHHGLKVWAMERHGPDTAGARLMRRVGAKHVDSRKDARLPPMQVVLETTGAAAMTKRALEAVGPNGVAVLLGVPHGDQAALDQSDTLEVVLENKSILGSVNASPAHMREAIRLLGRFERAWPKCLDMVVTHWYPPTEIVRALEDDRPDIVKTAIRWSPSPGTTPKSK